MNQWLPYTKLIIIIPVIKCAISKPYLRIGEVFEDVAEWLPVRAVEQPAKRPDEAEQVEPLDVKLSADLIVVSQHRAEEAQAGLKHPHQGEGQAGPAKGETWLWQIFMIS